MNTEEKAKMVDRTQSQLPEYYKANRDLGAITNSTGNAIFKMDASLTVGQKGPIVLQDAQLLETLSRFNRERIPERIVHAKGASAAGVFTCTANITNYTSATVFDHIGKQTNIRVRFSTVAGNLGSADTVRDPRGFAIKFYTEDGIWDLVGNNTPIFFIRDPIMFPMFIHSQKRNPVTHMRDWNALWDFISLRQETTHQVMFLMSDRGIPDGHRHMHGYGSHTFTLINKEGKKTYCKFHYKTQQGIKNILAADADILAGTDPDYGIKDLYNAIANNNFPKWTFYIQTMTEEQAAITTFDPFDVTKVWPHKQFPLQEVGEFELNKNPENYFAEVEQLAFSPSNFIPGIEASPDRMLLGRIFAYPDAHMYRMGPNFNQLPVNDPGRKVQNFMRDGTNVMDNQGGAPNYHPNSFGGPNDDCEPEYVYPTTNASGNLIRYDTTGINNFSQATDFYQNVLQKDERQRLADNIVHGLQFACKDVQDRTVKMFKNVDPDLAQKICKGLKKDQPVLKINI